MSGLFNLLDEYVFGVVIVSAIVTSHATQLYLYKKGILSEKYPGLDVLWVIFNPFIGIALYYEYTKKLDGRPGFWIRINIYLLFIVFSLEMIRLIWVFS